MLTNDTYDTLLMAKMKMEQLHALADQPRMASIIKKEGSFKHNKAVTFILHKTGKALINSGNRLLKIA